MGDLHTSAIDIYTDIEDFFESYILSDIEDEADLVAYVERVEDLKKIFRRNSAQIKSAEGADAFNLRYPNFEVTLNDLKSKFDEAKIKLIETRKVVKEQQAVVELNRQASEFLKVRTQAVTKWQLSIDQINWFFQEIRWSNVHECDDVQGRINSLETSLSNLCKTYVELKSAVPSAELDPYQTLTDEAIQAVRDHIHDGSERLKDLRQERSLAQAAAREMENNARTLAEQSRMKREEEAERANVENLLISGNSLKTEIRRRYVSLSKKIDVSLSALSDFEVLEISKKEDTYRQELSNMLDKISSLIQYIAPCGEQGSSLRSEVLEMEVEISKGLDSFLNDVRETILERDISEKKLKNAAGLKIEIPKFKGYHSEMDIFTLRTEFKKLVEPEVQKCLWADYLKKKILVGPALNLVHGLEEADEIWSKLVEVYGNTQLLLQNKLGSLGKFANLETCTDDEKISYSLASVLNIMSELSKLAEEHDLCAELYYGGGLQRVMELVGNERERRFIRKTAHLTLKNDEKWVKLVEFLRGELREREAYVLNEKSKKSLKKPPKVTDSKKPDGDSGKSPKGFPAQPLPPPAPQGCKCLFCGSFRDHVISIDSNNQPYINYFACKKFVDMTCRERNKFLFSKKWCAKCLTPGVKHGSSHVCDDRFLCTQQYFKYDGTQHRCQKHVLICHYHCAEPANKQVLEKYQKEVIGKGSFLDFSKKITIGFSESYEVDIPDSDHTRGVFAFQTIEVAPGLSAVNFYDSGCGSMVARKSFIDKLSLIGRATLIQECEVSMEGVNQQKSVAPYGIWEVRLPLKSGKEAVMIGAVVDEITVPFPMYPLKKVEEDIRRIVAETEPWVLPNLPDLPDEVGGEVDIMFGRDYLKYTPREVTRLDSGLTVYDSMFRSPDGSTGVVAGPHPEFEKTERLVHFCLDRSVSFCTDQALRYLGYVSAQDGSQVIGERPKFVDPDLLPYLPNDATEEVSSTSHPLDHCHEQCSQVCEIGDLFSGESGVIRSPNEFSPRCKTCLECATCQVFVSRPPRALKRFEEGENLGTDVSYRCVECRKCTECKRGALVEEISIRQEHEQSLIDESVILDTEKKVCIATLPFLDDPDKRLVNNVKTARRVYDGVLKSLSKNPDDKQTIIDAEAKLQKLGFVQWLENLSQEDQSMILEAPIQYYFPWRVVWSDSVTTPCRPVFDGTMPTPGGSSLNEILAKGTNNMNNLVDMLIRWSVKLFGYHTDISKCYNAVKLDKNFWRFQLYLFDEDLDPNKEPRTKVIGTVIYGARPSQNQAERGIRLTADTYKDRYPKAHEPIHNDTYVDDCFSGETTDGEREETAQQLQSCLAEGGFSLKGFTFSGQDPSPDLSVDGESIRVAGLKWYPKDDFLKLNVGEIYFGRKVRGRRMARQMDNLDKLTLRSCVSMVAQVFDPTGKITPLTAGFKLDISYLHRSGLKWDDEIPENVKSIWKANFDTIQELGTLKYQRAIIPRDAKNLDITTIDAGDASSGLICAAVYVRFERKDGSFSCQNVFSRSKVLPEGTSTPRGEMMAATLNATTGFIVQRAFGDLHKKCVKLTDSTVALHWICSEDIMLKTWVRTRSIECNRLAPSQDWFYVDTKSNISDLGTRKGVKLADVAEGSAWINGLSWMSGLEEDFPIVSFDQIKLDQMDMAEVEKETLVAKSFHAFTCDGRSPPSAKTFRAGRLVVSQEEDQEIQKRYSFSKYLVNPNRFRFRKVIRIMSLALAFIWKLANKCPKVRQNKVFTHTPPGGIPDQFRCTDDRCIEIRRHDDLDEGGNVGVAAVGVVVVQDEMLSSAYSYFAMKATGEVRHFLSKGKYQNITREVDGILYYSGRILEDYEFGGYPDLCSAALDLCSTTFCVPVMESLSPVAIAVALEIHWFHPDVGHKGIEGILRQMLRVAHIIGGRQLAVSLKDGCKKCRILYKRSVDVAMGPVQDVNLCIAPPFYATQVDIFGPFKTYSSANKRATLKIWFSIFCCTTTGAIDIRAMDDYSTDSVVLAFIRFSCRYGYPKFLMPDAGSQLLKSCEDMNYSYTDTKQRLSFQYGVDFSPCPVGAHYVHGKVERKIREVKKSVDIHVHNQRLSTLQWETLMHQISNSINNLPIGLKNTTRCLENLDLITPNRLILGRNNERSPNAPLVICNDHKRLIETNSIIFRAWFKAWLVSIVPSLIERPKWHTSDLEVKVGDIVLFLKTENELTDQYQYGQVSSVQRGRDGLIRKIDIKYKNNTENVFRTTHRTVREIVVVSPVDEIDIYERLDHLI